MRLLIDSAFVAAFQNAACLERAKNLCSRMVFGAAMLLTACSAGQHFRQQLLDEAPLGSAMEQVASLCIREKLTCKRSTTAGFVNRDTGAVVGTQSMWAVVDERRYGLVTSTLEAFWGFNADGKLLDVWVWRTFDAI